MQAARFSAFQVRFFKDRARYKFVWQGALELAMRSSPEHHLFIYGMQACGGSEGATCYRKE